MGEGEDVVAGPLSATSLCKLGRHQHLLCCGNANWAKWTSIAHRDFDQVPTQRLSPSILHMYLVKGKELVSDPI